MPNARPKARPPWGSSLVRSQEGVRGKLGLPIERDLHFETDKTISAYTDEARSRGHIVT
jgi:hypothetical protein